MKNGKDSFRNTNLDSLLQKNEISSLYIAGLDAAECVNATIEAALNRNYKVFVIEDAVISKTPATMDSMMRIFMQRKVNIVTSDSLFVPLPAVNLQ